MQPELSAELEGKFEYLTTIVTKQEWQWNWLGSKEGIALVVLTVVAAIILKMTFKFVLKLSMKIPLLGYRKKAQRWVSACCGVFMVSVTQENCSLLSCSQCGQLCKPKVSS